MDTDQKPIEERTKAPSRLLRAERKMARTNRSLVEKGVLVNPGENIQAAVDAVAKDGNGIVHLVTGTHLVDYNITLPQGITLKGAGSQGATIINFNNAAFSIKITGVVGDNVLNSSIQDMLIQNSTDTAGIQLSYTQQIRLTNLVITNCTNGVNFRNSAAIDVERVLTDNCVNGFDIDGSVSDDIFAIRFYSSTAQNCSGAGFYTNSSATDAVQGIWFFGCRAGDNAGSGFHFAGGQELNSGLINCTGVDNTVHGFRLAAEDISVIGCNAKNNTQVGFLNNDSDNRFIGCSAELNGIRDYHIALQGVSGTFIGNNIRAGTATDPTSRLNDPDSFSITDFGENASFSMLKRVVRMQNNTGGSVAEGDVLIFEASSTDAFDTTTTQGDDKVVGMAMVAMTDAQWGYVLLEGKTTSLKVDGTTDIAAGDFLGTFTSVGISMKAAAGDMAFARAEEAYTANDSSGVIDAVLITPRKL